MNWLIFGWLTEGMTRRERQTYAVGLAIGFLLGIMVSTIYAVIAMRLHS